MLKICRRRPKYMTQTIGALVALTMLNLLKSVMFNLLMLGTGFFLGFMTVVIDVHHVAKHNQIHDYGVKIQQKVDELAALDVQYAKTYDQIRDIVKDFNMHIAHDNDMKSMQPIGCESGVGRKLWARKNEDFRANKICNGQK